MNLKIEVYRIGRNFRSELFETFDDMTEEKVGVLVGLMNLADPNYIYTYKIVGVAEEN